MMMYLSLMVTNLAIVNQLTKWIEALKKKTENFEICYNFVTYHDVFQGNNKSHRQHHSG